MLTFKQPFSPLPALLYCLVPPRPSKKGPCDNHQQDEVGAVGQGPDYCRGFEVGFKMGKKRMAVLAFVAALALAQAANMVLYDGGVRSGEDKTVTATTYSPLVGSEFAMGSSGLIVSNAGHGWTTDSLGPAPAATSPPTRNVTFYGDDARLWGKQWAVGANATILVNTGNLWTVAGISASYAANRLITPAVNLYGVVYGVGVPSAWAAGAGGTLLRNSGAGYTVVAAGAFLPSVAPTILYAPSVGTPLQSGTLLVTSTGTVYRSVSSYWILAASKPAGLAPSSLLRAFSFQDGVGIAVGDAGTVLRFDVGALAWNSSFSGPYAAAAPSPPSLSAVAVYGRNRVIVAGQNGAVAETFPDAAGWHVSSLPVGAATGCTITGLSFANTAGVSPFAPSLPTLPSVEDVWAVGCGLVFRRVVSVSGSATLSASAAATSWTLAFTPPSGVQLYGVFAHRVFPNSGAIVVGSSGTVLRLFQSNWTTVATPASSAVYTSVAVSSSGTVTIAGQGTASYLIASPVLPEMASNTYAAWTPSWSTPTLPAAVPSNTSFVAVSTSGSLLGNGSVFLQNPSGTVSLNRPSVSSPSDAFIGMADTSPCSARCLYDNVSISSAAEGGGGYPALVLAYDFYVSPYLHTLCAGWPRLDARPYTHLEFRVKYASTQRTTPANSLLVTYVAPCVCLRPALSRLPPLQPELLFWHLQLTQRLRVCAERCRGGHQLARRVSAAGRPAGWHGLEWLHRGAGVLGWRHLQGPLLH